jgi:hypothetical protein
MNQTPSAFVSELLDALERHTQATQANTAAVNSLLGRRVASEDEVGRRVLAGQLDALGVDAAELLEHAQVISDRLELLRQSLTIDQPPANAGSEELRESST